MQVNSAQDYLTMKKRQLIASTYHSIPPPQKRRTNAMFLSAMANGATQRQRFIIPTRAPGAGGAIGGATYTNWCCLSNSSSSAPGTFTASPTDPGIVKFNIIPPMSVTATRVVV